MHNVERFLFDNNYRLANESDYKVGTTITFVKLECNTLSHHNRFMIEELKVVAIDKLDPIYINYKSIDSNRTINHKVLLLGVRANFIDPKISGYDAYYEFYVVPHNYSRPGDIVWIYPDFDDIQIGSHNRLPFYVDKKVKFIDVEVLYKFKGNVHDESIYSKIRTFCILKVDSDHCIIADYNGKLKAFSLVTWLSYDPTASKSVIKVQVGDPYMTDEDYEQYLNVKIGDEIADIYNHQVPKELYNIDLPSTLDPNHREFFSKFNL